MQKWLCLCWQYHWVPIMLGVFSWLSVLLDRSLVKGTSTYLRRPQQKYLLTLKITMWKCITGKGAFSLENVQYGLGSQYIYCCVCTVSWINWLTPNVRCFQVAALRQQGACRVVLSGRAGRPSRMLSPGCGQHRGVVLYPAHITGTPVLLWLTSPETDATETEENWEQTNWFWS